MRIHFDNNENYIQAIADSLGKNPISLENWLCLHIEYNEELPYAWYAETLTKIKSKFKDIDCDIVQCPDRDTLFISQNLESAKLFEIAEELTQPALQGEERQNNIALYDLCSDWQKLKALLNGKLKQRALPTMPSPSYNFGEIASLQEVFDEAKKLRKARFPLHIMIVEDDPLTRRIVANSFKENYALITATNAQEAITNYLFYAPDIVFLDIGLPDTSGFSVLHQIIATDPQAYVVMFSGNGYLENVVSSLNAGALGFVSKPFKKEKMHQYIQNSVMHHAKSA